MRLDFAARVERELASARSLHPKPIASLHEGFAVMLEEFEEFKAEVFKKASSRKMDLILHELIQAAAMCQRTAEDVLGALYEGN